MSQSTVYHWVHHAHGQRLDRVDWHDRPHTTRTPSRTDPTIEDLVREELRPLLKAWLDENLPPLVERLVRAEIERVVGRVVP